MRTLLCVRSAVPSGPCRGPRPKLMRLGAKLIRPTLGRLSPNCRLKYRYFGIIRMVAFRPQGRGGCFNRVVQEHRGPQVLSHALKSQLIYIVRGRPLKYVGCQILLFCRRPPSYSGKTNPAMMMAWWPNSFVPWTIKNWNRLFHFLQTKS